MHNCSFCGKEYEENNLIEGKKGYICEGCVYISLEMIEGVSFENASPSNKVDKPKEPKTFTLLKPAKLKALLDEYVVGQDEAKRMVTTEVYAHLRKQEHQTDDARKHNICLVGPSGSGKTYLVECLAKQLSIPFIVEDATSLSKTGYIGNSASSMLERLYYAADGDVELAQRGIIFIDEIDKLSSRFNATPSKGDVGTTSVQQELLKMLEGTTMDLTISKGLSNYTISFDTRQILFIVGGAFVGLEEQKKPKHLGFNLDKKASVELSLTSSGRTSHQDLMDYGLTPELTGRLSLIVDLKPLTETEIKLVMSQSKGSVIRSYESRFKAEGIQLTFSDETLTYLAQSVSKSKLGVRGIEGQLSLVLNHLLYESLQNDFEHKNGELTPLEVTPELLTAHL